MGGKTVGTIGVALAATVAVGAVSASAAPRQSGGMAMIDRGIAFVMQDLERVEAARFAPVTDPHDDVPGEPNPIRTVGAKTFAFDGSTADPSSFAPEALSDVLSTLNAGDTGYFVNQLAFTLVVAGLDRSPSLSNAAISEVSVAWALFGLPVLESSQYANDPLEGYGNVVSTAMVDGQTMTGFSFVDEGAFAPGANPIPTFGFWRADAYYQAWVLPGIPERIGVTSSDAGEVSLSSMTAQHQTVTVPTVVTDQNDPDVQAESAEAVAGLTGELSATPPVGVEPVDEDAGAVDDDVEPVDEDVGAGDEVAGGDVPDAVDEGATEADAPADPEVAAEEGQDEEQDAERTAAPAPDEPTEEPTTAEAVGAPTPATGEDADDSDDGGPSPALVIVPVVVVGIVIGYMVYRRRNGKTEVSFEPAPAATTATPSSKTVAAMPDADRLQVRQDMRRAWDLRRALGAGATWTEGGWMPMPKGAETDADIDLDWGHWPSLVDTVGESPEWSGVLINIVTLERLAPGQDGYAEQLAELGLEPPDAPEQTIVGVGFAAERARGIGIRTLDGLTTDQAVRLLTQHIERLGADVLSFFSDRIVERCLSRGRQAVPGNWFAPTLGDMFGDAQLPSGTSGGWSGFFVNGGDGRVLASGDDGYDELVELFGFDGPIERSDAMMATVMDEVVVL